MRKTLPVLLFSLIIVFFCNAQARELSFRQSGTATREMKDIGLCAAHATIPIGSKATVINQAANKTVEVTIIKRIAPSPDRIIDLSSAAAAVLGLGSKGPVIVETNDISYPVLPSEKWGDKNRSTISPGPYDNGRIRLMLDQDTGRFSLFYLTENREAIPFFMTQDPRTSYLTVLFNNQDYRLGQNPLFKIRLGGSSSNPAIIFESSFLSVVQDFTFIKTAASSVINGVRMNVTITNKTGQPVETGLRFLLDTTLGEKEDVHFFTDQRKITNETMFDALYTDKYWASQNNTITLVGTLVGQNATRPDYVHFSNWKRLYDVSWKTPHVPGRNFNLLPSSIGDSAVCLYYEAARILPGGVRTISIVLSSEDESGRIKSNGRFGNDNVFEATAAQRNALDTKMAQLIQEDLASLKKLIALLDEYEASGTVSDEDLSAIEIHIMRIKERYGIY